MTPPEFDLPRAQKWFAIEANNLAWDLVEAPQRTAEQTDEMLHAAHVARFHWAAVGTPLNDVRALNLLVTAYCTAGIAGRAVEYARQLQALAPTVADQNPFDRVAVDACCAWAYRLSGDEALQQEYAAKARAGLENVPKEEARTLLRQLYGHCVE